MQLCGQVTQRKRVPMIYVYVQLMGTRTCSLSSSSVVPGLKGACSHAPHPVNFPWECKNVSHSAGCVQAF